MSNYYAVQRSGEYLQHYGVKGMRWGVRKAIATGNERALDRHYRKAAKKLSKLQDIGLNSKKYAKKALAYGAAAAGTGTLAVGGTKMASDIYQEAAKAGVKTYLSGKETIGKGLMVAGGILSKSRIKSSKHNPVILNSLQRKGLKLVSDAQTEKARIKGDASKLFNSIDDTSYAIEDWGKGQTKLPIKVKDDYAVGKKRNITVSNDTLYRIGAGTITAGLAAKSIQNAYRATHGAKYRQKANDWRNQMDEAFAGTKYQGHYEIKRKKKSRR